ncbi:Hypothetical predicted protein [Octopus vulgaris]|uniref:Uncharacterized protein n=1 Tax=Octopus vulgaris TaxID=6645 RepID=A0AA36BCL5_OCTVU|nr:Hypothetical predicted protein [Octopus vulgaris]
MWMVMEFQRSNVTKKKDLEKWGELRHSRVLMIVVPYSFKENMLTRTNIRWTVLVIYQILLVDSTGKKKTELFHAWRPRANSIKGIQI